MNNVKLAQDRMNAILELLNKETNDIHNWSELARRVRPGDEKGQNNLLGLFARCKRPDNPQVLPMEVAMAIADIFEVPHRQVYLRLNDGEKAPAANSKAAKAVSETPQPQKAAHQTFEGIPITIKCDELGINLTEILAHLPTGDDGPLFGGLSGLAVITPQKDPNHHKLVITIDMNGSTVGPLLGLVYERHAKKKPQEATT